MKKVVTFLLLLATLVCSGFAVACGAPEWNGTSLNDGGNVVAQGGFVAATDKYVYFINGQGDYTADNTFGAPIKGSLMAIAKTDVASGNYDKAEIVVPKLFTASDYQTGFYIADGYVYYGTPNTGKNSSGEIAYDEMVFAKTKLGTSETTELFKTSSLSTEYRIVEKDGGIFVVYYDASENAIKSYSEKTGETTVISVQDEEAETSLAEYKFIGEDYLGDAVVVYTETVYAEKYYEDKDSRAEEDYNKMYVLKAGASKAELLYDGSEKDITYALTAELSGYLFFKETDIGDEETTYGVSLKGGDKSEIKDADYIAATTYVVSLEEAYVIEDDYVIKTNLVSGDKTRVLKSENVSTLLFVKGTELFYYNADGAIAKASLSDKSGKETRVSESSASQAWYQPRVIAIGDAEYLFYCDNNGANGSYAGCVNLNAEVVCEEADDDADDVYYLKGAAFIGQKTLSDKAAEVDSKLAAIPSVLEYEIADGKITFKDVAEAKAAYEGLTGAGKALVDAANVQKLQNALKAEELGKSYFALYGIENYDGTEAQKNTYKQAYQAAKALRQGLIDSDAYDYEDVRDMLPLILKWDYQQADKLFAE